ncbi:uncharacterized protein BDR25DRAFT_293170 [Lindgomyces ingoldianus]|uniref:Uncharacterized protein n=1 Tax=Lindgomyces ingoldianus TaxID=673940 RepID=A0ACB6QIJ7_9PLEO|nr:uncharacterized protein BDR25DRAFT_293170 [Lindgomyces ingoldianus]KAF2466758.1 hypothetical protein BDR25DRAFT_293170 [Lindgomyces ingoldianus]
MERFRQSSSPPIFWTGVANGERSQGKKRPSIGRAAESFQSKLIASFKSVRKRSEENEQEKTSSFLVGLFRLPSEIHIHILSELCISDLLALRRTSHALNDLISTCGASLVRFWVKNKLGSLHTKLYPPPPPNQAALQYLLAMRRRHIASIRLTRELANFVLRDTLKHTSQRQKQMWNSVYEKMIPLVFAVGYFLEEHRRAILERDLGRIRPRSNIAYDICTTPGITSQERKIMKRLDPPMRLQYFYMYCFIVQVLTRKLRPPTYAGSVEKFVRGWTAHPASSEDIAFVLVLGGVSQVAKLLACRNYSERRRLLHNFITRLSPYESTAWRGHWRDIGVSSPALLDDIPCASIGITQLDQIWEPLIVEMMKPDSRTFTENQKLRYEEVKTSKKFINELMGYDILRGRPADGDDSDGDEGEM